MKFNKKILSIFLTVLMLVSTLGNSVFAVTEALETNIEPDKTELEGRVEGNKEVFTFDISKLTEKAEPMTSKAMPARAPRRAPVQYDTEVNITATGLNGGAFDWDALPNKEFKLIARWKTKDGKTNTKILGPFTEAKTYNLNVGWPVDGTMEGTADLETDFNQKVDIRVLAEKETSTGGSGKLVFDITFTELAEPRANVEYVDPYGRELTDSADLPTGTMPKVTAEGLTDVEIDLPNSSKEINMRESELIDEDELNTAANGLTFKVDNKSTGETVTIDNKEYKLDISAPNAKQIGTIKMIYQKDVIVPPTDNNGDPVTPADGYVRLTFDANENKQDGITGTHNNGLYAGKQKSYIDVKEGLDYTNKKLQDAIKGLSTTGKKLVNGKTEDVAQDAKKPWTPTVPTDKTPVTEATYNAQYTKSVAEQVTELGGLKPETIKVWKGDAVDWRKGVAPNTTNSADIALVDQLLDAATITDTTTPERNSSKAGKFEGKLLVTFGDGSTLTVEHQWLYVSEHIVTVDTNSTDPDAPKEEDLPSDKIEVRFIASTGVQAINTTGKTYVKPGTVFKDTDFPQEKDITFKDGYKGPVTWRPDDRIVIQSSPAFLKRQGYFRFTATAGKTVVPTDPENPNPGKDQVTVTFLQGDHGTLSGIDKDGKNVTGAEKLAFNVKKTATWKDMKDYIPTAVAEKEWKVADPAWDPQIPAEGTTVTAGTYTAQYAEDKTVVPTDPDKPNPGKDQVTVTFLQGEHGTLTGIDKTGTKVTGAAKLAYNVKKTATWADMAKYIPTAVAEGEWKVADPAWDPQLPANTETVVEKTYTAQYAEDKTTTKNSEDYDPHYIDQSGNPGTTVTVPAPTFTKKGEQGTVPAPTDKGKKTKFAKNDGTQTNVTVNPDTGAITVVIPSDAKVGDTITIPVDVTYPDESTETVRVTVTVTDKDKSATPTIDQPTEGDDKITGKGEPGATIVVTDKDGNDIGTTTVKPDRTWEVKVPTNKPLNKGDKITATQTETGKKPSDPAKETVKGKVTPPSFNYLTLTLDENYRGGEITHHDVYEGDLIERYLYTPRRRGYVFEGWSYRSDYLDEVRPGDRIYYSTTLYAIWSKDRYYDRDEREEEPEDTREVLEHKAYMFGYTDGTVRPNGRITRAEAAALVTRLLGIESIGAATKPMFTDTPSAWYNKAINAAVQRGIMKGYPDGRFRPNAPITRAEFTQMIAQIDNKPYGIAPFADVKGHWAELAIGREYQAKRIMGYPDGTFRPNAHITRCEAVVILNKMFERNYDDMSAINAMNRHLIKSFLDLSQSFWGYNDMVEATNSHDFKRRVKGLIQEDWVEVK